MLMLISLGTTFAAAWEVERQPCGNRRMGTAKLCIKTDMMKRLALESE